MSGASQLRVGAASDSGRIPVLDIGPFLTGDSGAAAPRRRSRAPSPAPARTRGFSWSPITAYHLAWLTTPLPAIIPGDDPGDQQPPERRGLYPDPDAVRLTLARSASTNRYCP
jgi:hypothetical protein